MRSDEIMFKHRLSNCAATDSKYSLLIHWQHLISRLISVDFSGAHYAQEGGAHAPNAPPPLDTRLTMGKQTCINYYGETNMHQLPWGNKHASITMGKQTCINYNEETNMLQLLWSKQTCICHVYQM